MYHIFQRLRFINGLVAASLFLLTINVSAFAQDEESETNVANVRVSKQGRINLFIEYDLEGSEGDLFTVSLTVKLKSDSAYAYTPINVIGDVGANIQAGNNKRISWRISDEYIPAFDGDDVQYVISAISASEGSGAGLYIVGGVAVVGLAVVIAVLSSGKDDPTQTTNAFPLPPGRP